MLRQAWDVVKYFCVLFRREKQIENDQVGEIIDEMGRN